jgi:hypothetical protein
MVVATAGVNTSRCRLQCLLSVIQSYDKVQDKVVHAVPGQDPKSGEGEGWQLVEPQWLSRPLAGNETKNDACWNEKCLLSQFSVPRSAAQRTTADVSHSGMQLKGQAVVVLCTVLLLPEDKDEGGNVLGDVLVAMDRLLFSLADQWFALSLSPTLAHQPRVIHPAPLVEIHLRLAYQRTPQLCRAPAALPLTPRAMSPHDGPDEEEAGDKGMEAGDTSSWRLLAQRLLQCARSPRSLPRSASGSPDKKKAPAFEAWTVTVRLLSTKGIETPRSLDAGEEAEYWCNASLCLPGEGGNLKGAHHVSPDRGGARGAVLNSNNMLAAQACCSVMVAEGDLAARAPAGGWATQEMALRSVVEWTPDGVQGPYELSGQPVLLLVTLHGRQGTNEQEIARVLVPIREGVGGDVWCLAFTRDHLPVQSTNGQPNLIQLSVAYGCRACAVREKIQSIPHRECEYACNTTAIVPPIFSICNLYRAMVAAGPPRSFEQEQLEQDQEHATLDSAGCRDFLLPGGWISRISRSFNRAYYCCPTASRSTWKPPTGCRLAVARAPQAQFASPGVAADTMNHGDWAVRLSLRASFGLAKSDTPSGSSPLSKTRGAKVPRFKFAVSLIWFEQGSVEASQLLSLEHLLSADSDSAEPDHANTRNTHTLAPQAVSQWVPCATNPAEIMETFVLRRAVVVEEAGIVCTAMHTGKSDEGAAGEGYSAASAVGQGPVLEVALKGRVVLLLVTAHAQDDCGALCKILFSNLASCCTTHTHTHTRA